VVSGLRGTLALAAAAALAIGLPGMAAIAPGAGAEGFGELTRFGESGQSGTEGTLVGEGRVRLGVDPRDNSAYVLDEPEPAKQTFKENKEGIEVAVGPNHRFLRLQRFSPGPHAYAPSGAVRFTEASPPAEFELEAEVFGERDVQGIAVDSARKRVYVLAVDRRQSREKLSHDVEAPVASTLYAFSTAPVCNKEGTECKLVAAEGTKTLKVEGQTEQAVLVGPQELESQSDTPGRALLDPRGITVDPETGAVLILAHEDATGEEIDELESAGDHYVLQRIPPAGGAGERYVDSHDFIKLHTVEGERELRELPPDSPLVVQPTPGGAEHILVKDEGLMEIPYGFAGEPRFFSTFTPFSGGTLLSPLASSSETFSFGSQMAAVPGGPIYVGWQLANEAAKAEKAGVVELSAQDGAEIGWTGGQSPTEASESRCVIQPGFVNVANPPVLAAGSEGKVFVLSRDFLEGPPPHFPAVIEFGPGGTGCPQAGGAAPLQAEVNHQRVEEVPVGESVTFKTGHVSQADALAVEWDFGDGTVETLPISGSYCGKASEEGPDPQCPHAQHAYKGAGSYAVSERIHTDALAGPSVISVIGHIVVGGAGGPHAVATGPESVEVNQPARFDGSPSWDPAGPNQITEYHWNFGDGHSETTSAPSVEHTYSGVGEYGVSLTVTDLARVTSGPYPLPVMVTPTRPVGVGASLPATPSPGAGAVAATKVAQPPPVPNVRLASAILEARSGGIVRVILSCPQGETACMGTIALSALLRAGPAHARGGHMRRATVARSSFSLAGGTRRPVDLRLSRAARAMLRFTRVMNALVTIVAHDPAGASHITTLAVSVQAARARPRRHRR
jgi:PKD repeat protein